MISFFGLTKRNMLVYLKDRQAVIFSMITPIIVFGLYILFLRGNYINSLENSLYQAEGLIKQEDIEMFANLILLSGVIGSSVITVTYSSLTRIVADKERKIDYDISATPVRRVKIICSYLLAAFINSFIMTSILLSAGLLIISLLGDTYLSFIDVLALYGITALGALSATTFFMIFMLLFKSTSSAGAFQGLLAAAVGFVIGAYLPISEFNPAVQTIANLFPGSHVTALYRHVLLDGVLDSMNLSMNGIDNGILVSNLKDVFSTHLYLFENKIDTIGMVLYTSICALASVLIISALYNKLYKRR